MLSRSSSDSTYRLTPSDYERDRAFWGLTIQQVAEFVEKRCGGNQEEALQLLTIDYLQEIRRRELDLVSYRCNVNDLQAYDDFLRLQEYAHQKLDRNEKPKPVLSRNATDLFFAEARMTTARRKGRPAPQDLFERSQIHPYLRVYVKSVIKNAMSGKRDARWSLVINHIETGVAVQRWPAYRTIDILKYLQDEFNDAFSSIETVYDPCGGWGDRECALLACRYNVIVNDLNPALKELYEELHTAYYDPDMPTRVIALNKPSQEVCPEDYRELGRYQLVHTGLPYFNLELYNTPDKSIAEQDAKSVSYTQWLNGFVRPTIVAALEGLSPGGLFCLNVGDCGRRKPQNDILDMMMHMPGLIHCHLVTQRGKRSCNPGRNDVHYVVAQRDPANVCHESKANGFPEEGPSETGPAFHGSTLSGVHSLPSVSSEMAIDIHSWQSMLAPWMLPSEEVDHGPAAGQEGSEGSDVEMEVETENILYAQQFEEGSDIEMAEGETDGPENQAIFENYTFSSPPTMSGWPFFSFSPLRQDAIFTSVHDAQGNGSPDADEFNEENDVESFGGQQPFFRLL